MSVFRVVISKWDNIMVLLRDRITVTERSYWICGLENHRDEKNEAGAPQTLNYSVTGYNNKKLLPPSFSTGVVDYPLPLFRMAELYLNLAEAYAALGETDKCIDNLDVVRMRAGIPDVKDAWDNYSTQPKYYENKENLMEIVRRERMLELYMEGHQFYDIRRWKIAEQFLGVPVKGLNTLGETDEDF